MAKTSKTPSPAMTVNSRENSNTSVSSLKWPEETICQPATVTRQVLAFQKILKSKCYYSFVFKTVFAQSSLYENKVAFNKPFQASPC